MSWYLKALRNYAVFNGRAQRKEYWFFALFDFMFILLAVMLDSLLFSLLGTEWLASGIPVVYVLAVLIPRIAVTVRRLHDTDRTAWWILVVLVPYLGGVILMILAALPGSDGTNRFGPDPLAVEPLS